MRFPAVGSRGDLVTGVVLLSFFVLLLFVIIPAEISTPPGRSFTAVSPAFLPIALGATGVLFSALLIAHAFRVQPLAPGEEEVPYLPWQSATPRVALTVIVALSYYALFDWLGALPISIAAMLILLPLGHIRPWWRLAAYALALPTVVYLVFIWVARVPMPRGISLF